MSYTVCWIEFYRGSFSPIVFVIKHLYAVQTSFKCSVLHTNSDSDNFIDSKKGHSFAADSLFS